VADFFVIGIKLCVFTRATRQLFTSAVLNSIYGAMYTAADVSGSVIHLHSAQLTRMKKDGNPLDRLYVN